MQEEIRASRPFARIFAMRQWLFYVVHVAIGIGAVMCFYRFGPVAVLGTLLATIVVAVFLVPAKPALVDLGFIAVFCEFSIVAVKLGDWPREFRMGPPARALWRSVLFGLGVFPVVVGLFRERLSAFAVYTVAFLFPVGLFCLLDDDPPTLAMVLWTASWICFASTAACRHCVRQRRWNLLPMSALCLLFGELVVVAFSWAIFFFE